MSTFRVLGQTNTSFVNEPWHDKTNKITVRPVKTQISLGIRPVWAETSPCAQWVAKDQSFLQADSINNLRKFILRSQNIHIVGKITHKNSSQKLRIAL